MSQQDDVVPAHKYYRWEGCVTAEEVEKLAHAATSGLRKQHGYLKTTVHSYDPVILAHHFATHSDSHAFALYLVAPKNIRYSIDPGDALTVLERRAGLTL
jgi:hypothetical protein